MMMTTAGWCNASSSVLRPSLRGAAWQAKTQHISPSRQSEVDGRWPMAMHAYVIGSVILSHAPCPPSLCSLCFCQPIPPDGTFERLPRALPATAKRATARRTCVDPVSRHGRVHIPERHIAHHLRDLAGAQRHLLPRGDSAILQGWDLTPPPPPSPVRLLRDVALGTLVTRPRRELSQSRPG